MSTRLVSAVLAACAAPALLHAEDAPPPIATPPQKVQSGLYSQLWTNSPFTTKPVIKPTDPLVNPFDDLALRGVAPLGNGGYMITMVNKKSQEITRIDTQKGSDFTVLKVERDPSKRLGTVVHLSKGGQTGTVSYDEKIAGTIKNTAPKPNPQGVPGQPPMPGQPQFNNGQQVAGQPPAGIRPPRQRVVMPPTPSANQGNNIRGTQPQPRPVRR